VSDTAGEIFFNSVTVPYLQINASTGISGTSVDLSLSGSTGIGLRYDLAAQSNIGVTVGFQNLIPDFNNSIYYQSDGGVTYATQVLFSPSTSPQVLVKQRDIAVYPYSIPELGGDVKVRFNNGKWYITHDGNTNLVTSSNGLSWETISMGSNFSATRDIAFNNTGMGIVCGEVTTSIDKITSETIIDEVPLKLFLNEKIILPVPLVDFPYVTLQRIYSIIFSTKWIAIGKTVGDGKILIIESDNGIEWASVFDSTSIPLLSRPAASELTSKSKIVFQSDTNTHVINLSNFYLTRSAEGVWSSTPVTYTLLDCDSNDAKTIFVTTDNTDIATKVFNNSGLSLIGGETISGINDGSVQWDGTKWYIITNTTNTYSSVSGSGFVLDSSTPVVGFNTAAFSNQVERVSDSYYELNTIVGDTGPFDPAVVDSTSQTFETIGATLQYVVSGATATPVRTSFATSDAYESFDLTFNSDILSSKTVEFIAGDETFKFNIGPNGFKVPFEFETNTSQKTTPSYYSFIADGLRYARTRDKGTAYEKLKPLLDECYDIYVKLANYSIQTTNPLLPEWLNTLMNEFTSEFLNGENDDYYFGKVNSIYGCTDVLKDNPYTGASGATYGIQSLGKILGDTDSSNFTNFKYYFEAACDLYGVTGDSILTSGETRIVEKFYSAVETAMSKAGYTFLKSGTAKKNFINQLLKFYSMEFFVSTDYTISQNLTSAGNTYFQPEGSDGADQKRNLLRGFLDYSKVDTYADTSGATLVTEPTYYTANSVFKVSYDTHILSFYVDSKLVHEFSVYSEQPMKIKLIANTIDSPRLSNGTYGFRNISLGENSQPSILLKRKIKELTAERLQGSNREGYLEKILKMNVIPSGVSTSLGTNEDVFVEIVDTTINYYYTISQFTDDIELLKLCGTKIIETDVPTYPVFSGVSYSDALNSSTIVSSFKTFAENVVADTAASTDDTVFLQFQADALGYLDSVVTNAGITTPAYGIEDVYSIFDAYIQLQNLYAKKKVLTDMGKTYPTTYTPIIGKSLLLNEYSADIENKLDQSDLNKLGGALTCSLDTMFGTTLYFNNTSVGSTLYNFLDEIKGLTGLAPLTYEKIFIEVQDAIGISLVAERITTQEKLLNPYSKFINYLKTQTFFVPENNKKLDNEIITYFYGSSIPSTAYLPILGVTYSDYTSVPTGTDLCIYDKTFPSELKYLYDINFSKNFPNVYDGMQLWFPLTDTLTDISYSQSYMKAMKDFREGANIVDISDLDVPNYKSILTAYNASTLPVASHQIDESGLFAELVVPRIRETLQDTFNIDVGNKNKYLTDVETELFKKHLKQGSTGTLYPGLTSGAAGDADKFYDLNSLYLKLADDYNQYIEGIVSTLISAVDTDPTFDSVGNLIRSVVNGATGLTGLNEYRTATGVLDNLYTTYRGLLGTPVGSSGNTGGLYAFDQYFTAYENFDDSKLRWTQMMTDLYTKDGPNKDTSESYNCLDFITSIPPLDTTRWRTMSSGNTLQIFSNLTGTTLSYGEKSYSRYNPYWKYFENDIVSYKGQLYLCVDTTRKFNIVNIPPGELYPALDGSYSQIESIAGIYQVFSGGSTVTNAANVGVASLYAWEEWHYDPGLSGTSGINQYLENPPEAQDKDFQGYPQEQKYILKGYSGGIEQNFEVFTYPYAPGNQYLAGELVKWNNTLYRCRGAAEIIKGVGVGQPPNFTNSSTSWTLIGLTGANNDNIPPGSNGVWKLIDNLDTKGNIFLENVFSEYESTKVYNIGEYVTYLGKRYQRLANGTILLQDGSIGTISGIAPVTTTISDNSWIACPYIDLTKEGKNIPPYDSLKPYPSGDLVVYNNIVYKNILNQGSTGLYVEGSQYSRGEVVIAYEGYQFLSLKDNNIDDPPYPRTGSSKFWRKEYDAPIPPPTIVAYNFQNDYNSVYHLSGGATLTVWYDGAVYSWKDPLNIDYSIFDPALSNLFQYGVVKGIEPPLPEPFNHWVVATGDDHTVNFNRLKGTAIGSYSPTASYQFNDIVFYQPPWDSGSYYFKCTGNGYGSCINEAGENDITELYVSSKEISFGRALFDEASKTRYNETFITTSGVNERDASVPKWGEGMIDDPWASYGFCRNLRYKLALGLELTTLTFKNDRDIFNVYKNYRPNFNGKPFVNYLNTKSKSVYDVNATSVTTLYSDAYMDTNYNTAEFYYYSEFLAKLNDVKITVEKLNDQNNQIYDYWLNKHGKFYEQILQEYFMKDAIAPSITGLPLYAPELKLDPFPSDGYAQGTVDQIGQRIDTLKIGELFLDADKVAPIALIHGKEYHPGGFTGAPGTSYTSELGSLLPFTYYDRNTTERYFNYHFEKTISDAANTTLPISSFIPGYTNAVKVVDYNNQSITFQIGTMNFWIASEKSDLLHARHNPTNFHQSWYRNQLAVYTGMNDYPIIVPILTSKDKEYCAYDIENVWIGTSNKTVGAIAPVKKNMWYTGSNAGIHVDEAFDYNNIWMEESFNQNKPGVGGQTGPEYTRYLNEPLFFDLKPNYYRFQEVEDTYNELFQTIEKTLPDQQFFDEDGRAGHGIEYRIGWRNLKYRMQNGELIRISADFYQEGTKTGSAIEVIQHNSPGVLFRISLDDEPKPITNFASGRLTTTGNGRSIKTCVITMTGSVRNNFADTVSISETLRYIITPTGLVLSNATNNRTPETPPSITTANNYGYWNNQIEGTGTALTFKPFGSIDRNVAQWAKDKDFLAEFQVKLAAVIILSGPLGGFLYEREERPKALAAKASEFWNNTRYSTKSEITISETDLYFYQGKKSFKKNQNFMSILAYVRHIKKCSQKPASTALPPRAASAIAAAGYKQEYEEIYKAYSNATRIALIVVVSLIIAASAIVTGGASIAAAGGLASLFTVAAATSLATAIVAAGVTAGISYALQKLGVFDPLVLLGQLTSDPGKLLFPPHETDAGLITRCAMLEQIMQQTNTDISTDHAKLGGSTVLATFATPTVDPVTYQEYNYAKIAFQNLFQSYGSEAIGATLISTFNLDIGKIQFLATQYITGDSVKQLNLFLPDVTKEYIKYNQLYQRTIVGYENQLFFPTLIRNTPIDRDAILRITYLQWEVDSAGADGKLILGSTGDRPSGDDAVCYVTISIEDPGEGFYDYDESGNQVPYSYLNPAPNTTAFSVPALGGATFSVQDLELIGKYCYDSPDPSKTAVYGLSTFNHFDREGLGFNGKVAIVWEGGNELVGKTFRIPSPIKSAYPFPNFLPPPKVTASPNIPTTSKHPIVNTNTNMFSKETGRLIQVGGQTKPPSGVKPGPVGPTPPPPPPPPPGPTPTPTPDPPPPPKPDPKPPTPDPKPDPPPKKANITRQKRFKLDKPPAKPTPKPHVPLKAIGNGMPGALLIVGAAIQVGFAIKNIIDITNTPPVNTNCTSISNRGNN
jgi:hypothetical protein